MLCIYISHFLFSLQHANIHLVNISVQIWSGITLKHFWYWMSHKTCWFNDAITIYLLCTCDYLNDAEKRHFLPYLTQLTKMLANVMINCKQAVCNLRSWSKSCVLQLFFLQLRLGSIYWILLLTEVTVNLVWSIISKCLSFWPDTEIIESCWPWAYLLFVCYRENLMKSANWQFCEWFFFEGSQRSHQTNHRQWHTVISYRTGRNKRQVGTENGSEILIRWFIM